MTHATVEWSRSAARDDGDELVLVRESDVQRVPVGGMDPTIGLVRVTGTVAAGAFEARDAVAADAAEPACRRALAYELVGLGSAMLDLTTEYAGARTQFGQPIGAFQAVKHRLADVLVALRAAEAAADESGNDDAGFAAAAAKCLAGRAFRLAAENCLQVMGAIGFTMEHELHHFIVRGTVLDVLYGSARELRVELGHTLLERGRVPRPSASVVRDGGHGNGEPGGEGGRPRRRVRVLRGGRRRGARPHAVEQRRTRRRVPRSGDDHAVHPRDLRGRGRPPAEGFLHPALFTDDLDAELEGHTVVWGPAVVEGAFGKRRIAFVEAPGGIRLEFMEQLELHPSPRQAGGRPMKVTRFHHVSVNSQRRARRRDGRLLPRRPRARRRAAARDPRHPRPLAPRRRLSSSTSSARRRRARGIDPTGHHYCVAVDDLDAAVAELEARGIEYARGVQGEGVVQIWITDPAGNTIELQQETRPQ